MSFRAVRRTFSISMLVVAMVLPFVASPASATPPNVVSAQIQTNANNVKVHLGNGSFVVSNGFLEYRNNAGKAVDRTPLTYIAPDNRTYPIDVKIVGRTATLVPAKNPARSTATPAALLQKTDVADANGYRSKRERDDAALARFNSEMAAAMTISAIVATAIGVVIGGTLGCILTVVVACIPGLTIGATLGGIAGTIAGGGGAAIISAQRYFDTINKPFKNVKPNN